ncbi:NADPH-dependent FMN reductase [Streptomyces sp. NPDC002133]|uniref:NADPH-dependent FMN reductase n=1 Tax=Streptomyces sp. NPDC002133 TaxID=3154409 RepID=UPI003326A5B3
MSRLLAISGSPSATSRTALVLEHIVRRLSRAGLDAAHLAVRDLPPAELLAGRTGHAALCRALHDVEAADGLIIATPVYKASYTGLLKAFLDLLPQAGLAGKTVLPLATGGSPAHVLTIDYALRPVLSALGARHVVAGRFLLDTAIERRPGGGVRVQPEAEGELLRAVEDFVDALPADSSLGAVSAPGAGSTLGAASALSAAS